MLSLRYYKIRTRLFTQFVAAMKSVKEAIRAQEAEIYQKYIGHCVMLIQKTWRGYYLRAHIKPRLMKELRALNVLRAAVKGWKIRKIMNHTSEVLQIKREMAEIGIEMRRTFMFNNTSKQSLKQITQLKAQRGLKVDELIKTIAHLYPKGRWIFSLRKVLQSS